MRIASSYTQALVNFLLGTINKVSLGICQLGFRVEGCHMEMKSNLSLLHVGLRFSVEGAELEEKACVRQTGTDFIYI